MHNIDYDYVKMLIQERESAMRRAQLAGTAYELQPRRRLSWPWARWQRSAARGRTTVAAAN